MDPRQIIDALIDGTNPVTGKTLDNASPWGQAPVIRALYNVLRVVDTVRSDELARPNVGQQAINAESRVEEQPPAPEPSPKIVGRPDPDVGEIEALMRGKTNLDYCCDCRAKIAGSHLTLTGDEPLLVFCDTDCFNNALRSLIYYFGWITVFDSSLDEECADCSKCGVRIRRSDHGSLNYVLHDNSYTNTQEVAILCSSCRR